MGKKKEDRRKWKCTLSMGASKSFCATTSKSFTCSAYERSILRRLSSSHTSGMYQRENEGGKRTAISKPCSNKCSASETRIVSNKKMRDETPAPCMRRTGPLFGDVLGCEYRDSRSKVSLSGVLTSYILNIRE